MKKEMMKMAALLIAVSFLFSAPAHAGNPASKLGQGVSNIVLSPIELVNGIKIVGASADPVTGVVGGLLAGTVLLGRRILVGAYEVVTFPIPFPSDYEPVLDPPTPEVVQ